MTSKPPMKQATLPFASSKRTSSASASISAKGRKPSGSRALFGGITKRAQSVDSAASVVSVRSSLYSQSESEEGGISESNSDALQGLRPPLKRMKIQDGRGKTPPSVRYRSKDDLDLDDLDRNGALRRHYAFVRQKMGHMKPIHAQGQSKAQEILRVFDLSYEYGPCIGVSRLERWERAEALGLNPPREVRDILLTKQAADQDELSRSVFHPFDI